MRRIAVINGPNLNMLGRRQPEVYGSKTLAEIDAELVAWGGRHELEIATFQSNHEGVLIDHIQECRDTVDGIVINPGAFGHTSYALHDALLFADLPTVEVHISNVHGRDPFRAVSVLTPVVLRKIFGRGTAGYRHALRLLVSLAAAPPETVAYGEDPEQVLDLRLPDGGDVRTAVLVHGGFWRHEWARDTIDSLAADLALGGWATANVEYRRLGCGGGWPETVDDIVAAVDHVAAAAGVGKVTLLGHSAGGQLALVAARSARVERVVALAAVADVPLALELGTGAPFLAEWLGDADPAGPVSPIADPPVVPHLVVHGTTDTDVPVELSRRYVTAARANGIEVTALYPDTGHFPLLDPGSEAWAATLAEL